MYNNIQYIFSGEIWTSTFSSPEAALLGGYTKVPWADRVIFFHWINLLVIQFLKALPCFIFFFSEDFLQISVSCWVKNMLKPGFFGQWIPHFSLGKDPHWAVRWATRQPASLRPGLGEFSEGKGEWYGDMGMDQYLYIPFLGDEHPFTSYFDVH